MKIRHLFLSLALIALSAGAAADSYAIDPVHASLVFRIKHLGVANFYGMFTEMSGAYDYDPEKPETNHWQSREPPRQWRTASACHAALNSP